MFARWLLRQECGRNVAYFPIRSRLGSGLGSLNSWVAAFALKVGQWLTGLYHYGGGLAASTTLPHDFRRQFYDWLGGRCHRLIRLGSELGFAKRNRSTSFSHRKNI